MCSCAADYSVDSTNARVRIDGVLLRAERVSLSFFFFLSNLLTGTGITIARHFALLPCPVEAMKENQETNKLTYPP